MLGGLSEKVISVLVEARSNVLPGMAKAREEMIAGSRGMTGPLTSVSAVETRQQLRGLSTYERELAATYGMNVGMPGVATAATKMEGKAVSEVAGYGARDILSGIPGAGRGLGMLGMGGFTPAGGLAMGGLALGMGGIETAKSLVDTYRSQIHALADLRQAYSAVNMPFSAYQDSIEAYLHKNARFISDVNVAREGIAGFVREGLNQKQALAAETDAMNLAAISGKDLDTTQRAMRMGVEGSGRGLKELGVSVKDYGDLTGSTAKSNKDLEAAQKAVNAASVDLVKAQRGLTEEEQRLHDKKKVTLEDHMHEADLKGKVQAASDKLRDAQQHLNETTDKANSLDTNRTALIDAVYAKVKNGTDTLDKATQSQNRLNEAWDRLSTKAGPPMIDTLAKVTDYFATLVTDIGDGNLGNVARDFGNSISSWNLGPLSEAVRLWGLLGDAVQRTNPSGGSTAYHRGGFTFYSPPTPDPVTPAGIGAATNAQRRTS